MLWQEIRLDWAVCRAQAGATACTWAARWLGRRLPICRRLLLSGCPESEVTQCGAAPSLALVRCGGVGVALGWLVLCLMRIKPCCAAWRGTHTGSDAHSDPPNHFGLTPSLPQLFPAGLSGPRLEEVRFVEVAGDAGNAALALLNDCPKLQSLVLAGPQSLTGERLVRQCIAGSANLCWLLWEPPGSGAWPTQPCPGQLCSMVMAT